MKGNTYIVMVIDMDEKIPAYVKWLSRETRAKLADLLSKGIAEETDRGIDEARKSGGSVPRRNVHRKMAEMLRITHVSVFQILNRSLTPSDRLTAAIINETLRRRPDETRQLILEDVEIQQRLVKMELEKLSEMIEKR